MSDCRYCGWKNGYHNENCPENFSGDEKALVLKMWNDGYSAGRSGKAIKKASKYHRLGELRGIIALEEAENC